MPQRQYQRFDTVTVDPGRELNQQRVIAQLPAHQVMAMPEQPKLRDGKRPLAKSVQHSRNPTRIQPLPRQLHRPGTSGPQQQHERLAQTYLCHIGLAQTRMRRDIHA